MINKGYQETKYAAVEAVFNQWNGSGHNLKKKKKSENKPFVKAICPRLFKLLLTHHSNQRFWKSGQFVSRMLPQVQICFKIIHQEHKNCKTRKQIIKKFKWRMNMTYNKWRKQINMQFLLPLKILLSNHTSFRKIEIVP